MTRARVCSSIAGAVVLVLLASQRTSAIGPAFITFHGGRLAAPVVVRPAIGSFVFVWAAGSRFYEGAAGTMPAGLEGRRFLEFDVFWGAFDPSELTPAAASQHGRLYLPTADQPAAIISTAIVMTGSDPAATRAPATPVPTKLEDFRAGRALTAGEMAVLVSAGLPMN